MKATVDCNIPYCKIVEEALQVTFEGTELRLGGWGDADNHVFVADAVILLAEIENGQKHPQTNVLKLWPYLEERKEIKIVLIHWLTNYFKVSLNRRKLCEFTGNKLMEIFPDRFRYVLIKDQVYENELKQAKKFIKELTK